MGQDNKKTAYFDDYALFWVADVYSDSNGQLFSHSAKLIVLTEIITLYRLKQ